MGNVEYSERMKKHLNDWFIFLKRYEYKFVPGSLWCSKKFWNWMENIMRYSESASSVIVEVLQLPTGLPPLTHSVQQRNTMIKNYHEMAITVTSIQTVWKRNVEYMRAMGYID